MFKLQINKKIIIIEEVTAHMMYKILLGIPNNKAMQAPKIALQSIKVT